MPREISMITDNNEWKPTPLSNMQGMLRQNLLRIFRYGSKYDRTEHILLKSTNVDIYILHCDNNYDSLNYSELAT